MISNKIKRQKSILVIEDDVELSQMLSTLLKNEGYKINVQFDGVEGLRIARSGEHFDLILVDLMLPGIDGFEVIRQLRATHVTPVIMVTAKDHPFERVFGLEIGADDFIAKPFDARELVARIKTLFRRLASGSNTGIHAELKNGDFRLDYNKCEMRYKEDGVILTNTEFAILQVLWVNCGAPVSKEQLSQILFNKPLAPYDRTIDMHISNLRKKFGQFIDKQCIRTVRGCGYQMVVL